MNPCYDPEQGKQGKLNTKIRRIGPNEAKESQKRPKKESLIKPSKKLTISLTIFLTIDDFLKISHYFFDDYFDNFIDSFLTSFFNCFHNFFDDFLYEFFHSLCHRALGLKLPSILCIQARNQKLCLVAVQIGILLFCNLITKKLLI